MNEKNQLFQQTAEQANPGLARPEDFTVESEQLEHGGQCGDTNVEYRRLLKVRQQHRPSEVSNYDSRPDVSDSPRNRRPFFDKEGL